MPWRARPDLCGGRWETSVPTAMDGERARSSSDLQAQQLADAQRENTEHQVTVGLPVAAHAKMAPTELVLEAGVHSLSAVERSRYRRLSGY